jgi:hypothetical protein
MAVSLPAYATSAAFPVSSSRCTAEKFFFPG